VRVRIAGQPQTAAHFGRRELGSLAAGRQSDPDGRQSDPDGRQSDPDGRRQLADLFDEAADYVEVLRRLWDSWEDDAEIRDVATGRFIDREKLHYIGFEGRWFSVKGPSITPRPPQGQPLVAALGHAPVPYRLIARSADLGFITPRDREQAEEIVTQIRAAQTEAGQTEAGQTEAGQTEAGLDGGHLFADVMVFLDDAAGAAAARRRRLDERAGAEYRSDAHIFAGTPAELADLLLDWQQAGLTGYRLRPAALPHDLIQITGGLVPELQRRGAFRVGYPDGGWPATLRGLLGLPRPANRYQTRESVTR
jgi:alkanesulfonate monooxygenase SsuD/methylene tetrahydromethanopterin reductase-like flavin-dependent oxidoreductase (luciferase family)